MTEIIKLFTDGGVLGRNPSLQGGTWAFCAADKLDRRVLEMSGFVLAPTGEVMTNNHTEQLAIVRGLEAMPSGWCGTVYSDSAIALGRVFCGHRCNGLPAWIQARTQSAMARLGDVRFAQVKGHPTKKELLAGRDKQNRYLVSALNVWCDAACDAEKRRYNRLCKLVGVGLVCAECGGPLENVPALLRKTGLRQFICFRCGGKVRQFVEFPERQRYQAANLRENGAECAGAC